MAALRNITIAYNGGGMTEEIYNGYPENSTNPDDVLETKSNYRAFLSGLSDQTNFGDARWLLTYEIYIPSGTTVSIPKDVVLVANGGYFSAPDTQLGTIQPGTLRAFDGTDSWAYCKNTRIEAGFEQIFTPELNLTGIWDVSLAHPEWFGVTSVPAYYINQGVHLGEPDYNQFLENDDSIKIQKTIDLVSSGGVFIDGFPDLAYNVFGALPGGSKVVCQPENMYNIKKTVYLPLGVSFDGGNSNFVYSCPPGTYMFKVNMQRDGTDWEQPLLGLLDTICNIQMINPNDVDDAYGIYSASQLCTFENIRTRYFCQTFKRHGEYLDCITLRNIFADRSRKTANGEALYMIDTGYIGDNLLIDNISISGDEGALYNINLLKVYACGGGVIQRVLNGTIYIVHSKSLTISGVHQELGNTIIENSQVEINGMTHFKHPGIPAFSIRRSSNDYTHRAVEIKNVMILYNLTRYGEGQTHHLSPYSSDELDIELQGVSGAVKIENVFRSLQRPWTEASSLYGIRVNNVSFMRNQAANSISSIAIGNDNTGEPVQGVLLNNHIAYQITQTGSYGVALDNGGILGYDPEFGTGKYFPSGTYTYRAAILLDKKRNIGYYDTNGVLQFTVASNASSAIQISFFRQYYLGMYIRLFRTRVYQDMGITIVTTDYIDLPVCSSNNSFIDLGDKTQFCETWNEVDDNQLSALIPQTCYNYQFLGNNVYVKMAAMPTNPSDWEPGDLIYLTSNNSLNVI